MSSLKKTIQINPELFKMAGGKTRKNKEKKEKPKLLITPNSLKTKLLNRIKSHKENELKEVNSKDTNTLKENTLNPTDKYTDEFYGALGYLSDLSKKHKKDMDKIRYEKSMQGKKEDIHNKTVRHYPHVELELPHELQEPIKISNIEFNSPIEVEEKIGYAVDTEVPHGCLRNGQKPTYRTWKNQTRKNVPTTSTSANPSPIIPNTNTLDTPMNREQRLSLIKNKLKTLENSSKPTIQSLQSLQSLQSNKIGNHIKIKEPIRLANNNISINKNHINKNHINENLINENHINENLINENLINENIINENIINQDVLNEDLLFDKNNTQRLIRHNNSNNELREPILPSKKLIKKTIRRKFTLGKSNIYRKVGVLIKDKNTRRKILNAHTELKKTSIGDIKKYLRAQGIIKIGSTAPNDVLRKTYENSRLAGEINNTNNEVLIHNFLNSDETNNL